MEAFIKGECRHCKGHLEFPEELLGSRVNCPHCQGEVTLKPIVKIAARAQANSPLPAVARLHLQPGKSAKPAESPAVIHPPLPAGLPPLPTSPAKPATAAPPTSAAKPDAKAEPKPEEKPATPAAVSPASATRRRLVFAVLVLATVLSALGGGIYLARQPLLERFAKLRAATAGWLSSTPAVTNAAPQPPKLLVLSYDLERQEVAPPPVKKKKNKKSPPPVQPKPLIYVSGVATNVSTNACLAVKVTFELLDTEGKPVDTNSDEIFRLEGQSDWRFRALVTHPGAAKPHLLSIQAQP